MFRRKVTYVDWQEYDSIVQERRIWSFLHTTARQSIQNKT